MHLALQTWENLGTDPVKPLIFRPIVGSVPKISWGLSPKSESAIADLTPNQLTVLKGLAELGMVRVFTAEFMDHVRISSSGAVKRALNSLVASRLIFQHRTEYKFSNPFFREWIKTNL